MQGRVQPIFSSDFPLPKGVMIMTDSFVLGIDVAKASFDAALRSTAGKVLRSKTFANNPEGFAQLRQWVGPLCPALGLEATGSYWMSLAHQLHGWGWTVFLLNPAYVKNHARAQGQRHKTDRIDAALIADFVCAHQCEPWQPLPAELEELRELMRLYQDVTAMAASLAQRREGVRTTAASALLEEITKAVKAFAKRVLAQARAHAQAHASLQAPVACLESIPGVGAITALTLTAELPRGKASRSVACWAGLTPRFFESGESVRKRPRLSKQGSDYVRQILYWPAITALRCNPAMQIFAQRLQGSGHNKMQIIGAAMHKLLRWATALIHTRQNFNPALHLNS
jgi:transposase